MPPNAEKKPTVFISYSHKDEEWKERFVTHLGVLHNEGLLDLWEDRRIAAGDEWYQEIEEAMNAASIAVMLVSANFLNSKFILTEEVPRLLQHRAEKSLRVFPVIIKPFALETVGWLRRLQLRPKDARPLSAGNENQIDSDLASIATEIYLLLRSATTQTHARQFVPLAPEKISISRLPTTGPNLFGRELEVEMLDGAWADRGTNVISLVAWGGVGKSALVNHWLRGMREDNYREAERIYAWSFYRQGTTDQVSAGQFIESALKWFGDPNPAEGLPWDKGERLAQLIRTQPTLLLLDGLEPLQTPPGQEGEGKLKDQAMQALLRELAAHNPGLCLISTRIPVTDLSDFEGSTVRQINLEHLSPKAGAEVLKAQGVKGDEAELEEASREFGGHSLALTLLGSYLNDVFSGDIRRRSEVGSLEDDVRYGGHAHRVMAAYEKWFGEQSAELAVLRMLGLFDRPADGQAIIALRAAPEIPNLTSALQTLRERQWQRTLSNLRRAKLLSERDPNQPDAVDAHPLVREHFRKQLKQEHPDAWREGNNRLYEHLKRTTKEFPDTIEEMAPLYAAVAHGCEANRHQDALREVYWQRILRKEKFFSYYILGARAHNADLACLSNFFDVPWSQPVSSIRETSKLFVLSEAGYYLYVLGRLKEAIDPMKGSLNKAIEQKDFDEAARNTSTLSRIFSALGDFDDALSYARQSIEWADRSGNMYLRSTRRTALGAVLHQQGRISEAEIAFNEAEKIRRQHSSSVLASYAEAFFRHCDLLLDEGKYEEVQRLVREFSEELGSSDSLLAAALKDLTSGQAYLLQARQEGTAAFSQATECLEQAMSKLRKAGQQIYILRGLLARAELYRSIGNCKDAQADLEETLLIAVRNNMDPLQADCHLEYTRLCLTQGEKEKARESWAKAKELIERMGYHRRDKEVLEIGRQLEEMPDE